MGARLHEPERLSRMAMAVYGEKLEDLEEFELRELHELDGMLAGTRLGPRAHARVAAARQQVPEAARRG